MFDPSSLSPVALISPSFYRFLLSLSMLDDTHLLPSAVGKTTDVYGAYPRACLAIIDADLDQPGQHTFDIAIPFLFR
jgi:hypothetical protein